MDFRAIAMGLAFALMWSSAFATARFMVVDAPPLTVLAARFLVSGCIGLVLARALGQSWRLTRPQLRGTILFGIGQNGLYLGAYFVAMSRIEASLAAIIASSMPLVVALASWAIWRERQRALGIAGLIAGFSGVLLILGARIEGGADLLGVLLCVGGVMALAFATLMVRGATSGGNILMVVSLQMLVGAVLVGIPALVFEPFEVRWSVPIVVTFVYSALVPGLAATWVWFLLVRRIGAVRAATFHFLNPAFGVIIAAILLGESMGLVDAVGVGIVMLGILAVQVSRQPPKAPPPVA